MPAPTIMDLGSGIDVPGTIRKLIDIERIPLRRMERDNSNYQSKVQAWEKLIEHTKQLADISRELHSSANPFTARLLESEQPEAISGDVINNAPIVQKKIKVKQLAFTHELHSKPLVPDTNLPKGSFTVKVKDKKTKIFYPGGTWKEFKDLLEEKLPDILEVQEFDASEKTKLLILRSRVSGENGKIQFQGSDALLIQAGILQKKRRQLDINLSQNKLSSQGRSETDYQVNEKSNALQIQQGAIRLDLQKPYLVHQGDFLRLQIKAQESLASNRQGPVATEVQEVKVGPKISVKIGDVLLSGKHIARTREVPIGESWHNADHLIVRVTTFYTHKGKRKSVSFLRILREGDSKKLSLPLAKKIPIGASIQALRFYTNGKIKIKQPYFEQTARLEPVHEEKPAQNAILYVNGVATQSAKNTNLQNILPGATLQIKQKTKTPIVIKIKADDNKIIAKIKDWAGSYNTLLGYLRINMRTENETDISPPTIGNQSRPKKRGGFFATDSTTRQLLARMQTLTASAYPSHHAKGLQVLAEVGISSGEIGAQWEDIREGKLDLDETKLRSVVEEKPDQLQDLFRFDSNQDAKIDNGVAYKMNHVLRPYIQGSNGLLSSRVVLIKGKISANKEEIFRRELELERKQQSLREQFGRMERAIKRNRSLGEHLKRSMRRHE